METTAHACTFSLKDNISHGVPMHRNADLLLLSNDVADRVVQANVVGRRPELAVKNIIARSDATPDLRCRLPHHLREVGKRRVRRVIYQHTHQPADKRTQQKHDSQPSLANALTAAAASNVSVPAARFSPKGPSAPSECWNWQPAAQDCAFDARSSDHVSGLAPCCARTLLWPSM